MIYQQIKSMPEIDNNIYLSIISDGNEIDDFQLKVGKKKAEPFLTLPKTVFTLSNSLTFTITV
jgi:hypothetical protein